MFNNYAFQQNNPLNSHPEVTARSEAQTQQALVQASPTGGFNDSTSPNTMMLLCLTPFCIAFLLFGIHLVRYSLRLNRGLKRLQCIATLERALYKTPDECS